MTTCARCGHDLGIGRFCLNCGHPIGEPVPDVERAPLPPSSPVTDQPAPARSSPGTPAGQQPRQSAPPPSASRGPNGGKPFSQLRPTSSWPAWWPLAALVATIAVLAVVLVASLGGLGSEDAPPPEGTPYRTVDPSAKATDLTGELTAYAPRTAEPSTDMDGSRVTFDADNMVDGEPSTAWRFEGDATDMVLTFGLPPSTFVKRVGLVNGYDKKVANAGRLIDWYPLHRRITKVEWVFDDGTTITQDLSDKRKLQRKTLDEPVASEKVDLRILGVTGPGSGLLSRDYTAISEILIAGLTAE